MASDRKQAIAKQMMDKILRPQHARQAVASKPVLRSQAPRASPNWLHLKKKKKKKFSIFFSYSLALVYPSLAARAARSCSCSGNFGRSSGGMGWPATASHGQRSPAGDGSPMQPKSATRKLHRELHETRDTYNSAEFTLWSLPCCRSLAKRISRGFFRFKSS